MNRKPIYSKEDPSYRVISAPNGKWLLQRLSNRMRSNMNDGYDTLCMPFSDRAEAIGRLPADRTA